MRPLIASFVQNRVFANIVLVMIFVAGGMAAVSMVRETFPQFSEDRITISVPYPGADPEEVEEGISRKLEEALEDVEGIKEYATESRENVGTASIEVLENYDLDDVLERVRSRIDAISSFPVDAERPIIEEVLLKEPVVLLALSGDMPEKRIKEWAERLKDEIRQSSQVSSVTIYGTRPYEIGVEISEENLRQYGLSFADVAEAIRRSSITLAGGTLRTRGEEIRIRTVGRKYTGEELAAIVVLAGPAGQLVTLGQLGTIKDSFAEDMVSSTVNGRRALFLSVMKTTEQDAIEIAREIDEFVERKQKELPVGVTLASVYDSSTFLRARIRLLVKNGLLGLSFVFLLLWIFLDLRLSFWAGMGMPISIAGALVILWAVGGTLNMISLFGLIMVLGIIVDDAIVVGEAIYVHRRRGEGPVQAAVEGLCEVGLPVVAAVLTTITAFVPLAFIRGVMGKFIAILPVVVVACLVVSLVECLLLLPAHLGHMEDVPGETKQKSRNPLQRAVNRFHRLTSHGLEWFAERPYAYFVSHAIRWRYVSVCAAVAVLLLTLGLYRGGIIKFRLFPGFDGFIVTAVIEFPEGTPTEVTGGGVAHVEESVQRVAERHATFSGEPLIKYRMSLVGQAMGTTGKAGPHIGSVQVILVDSADRNITSKDLLVEWEKEIGQVPGVQALSFIEMEAGPPGAAIEIWLQGQDMGPLVASSEKLLACLSQYDGVYQVQSDYRAGRNEIRLKLRPEARTLGVTVQDLATQIHAGYFGEEAVRLQRGRDDIRVRVRYPSEERRRFSDFENVRIRTRNGQEIPLLSVAEVSFGAGYTSIERKNGMRNIAVSAEVDIAKANAKEIVDTLRTGFLKQLTAEHPGVYVSIRGEQKRSAESFGSLLYGFPLAMLTIFIILATIFRSYIQPLVILLTVPFGIIGAFLGHLLMGKDLSIMSMFGIVALSGVVVNDAIVLIECVNRNLASGDSFFDALVTAGRRRFRPVFLTTLSTVGGLLPLILETDFQAQFLIPMALSIAAGVCFATLLTLLLIPSLLAILNDGRRAAYWIRSGSWPGRNEVEPACKRTSIADLSRPSGPPAG